jgi:hypothetical protein
MADSDISSNYAWRRTDRYVPPNPEEFFPDDPEAGKRLDVLFDAVDKDRRSDEEILTTVRHGFRRTTKYRTLILSWIGNRYIWNKKQQNLEAIEIMYHAVPMERHYAIYFGLSVVLQKTPNILRTLAEICMQGEDVGRITWGIRSQRDELVSYIKPYLEHRNAEKREIASILLRHFRSELDFEKWKQEKTQGEKEAQFSEQLPKFREQLLKGNSQTRQEVLNLIMRNNIGFLLDNSFLEAMNACAEDRDPAVRRKVAGIAGGRWIWRTGEQNPEAIKLMLKLSGDEDRDTRYKAVYFGLSTVRKKTETVVRRLLELALTDHENNLYGRVVWGLSGADSELLKQILAEKLNSAKSNLRNKAACYLLYKDVLKTEPPPDWSLEEVKAHYTEDIFMVNFSAREPYQPGSADELWEEFSKNLPDSIVSQRLPNIGPKKQNVIFVTIRGAKASDDVKEIIENNPHLSLGQVTPISLQMQLFFEELQKQTNTRKIDVQVGSEPVVGDWQDIGQAIPPDCNDTIVLAEHINLDSIGGDVEGKTFIALLRDREKTKNQQYRFVIVKKDGTVVKPISFKINMFQDKLWEKFSFEDYHHSQIKEFQLQRFLRSPARKALLPLAKSYDPNVDGKVVAIASSGPPGRGALHFDGKGDYLYVPDSSSLWLGPEFTVEMWIKPEFPKVELENWPSWSLIGKGCTIGMKGRVKPRGFGITMHRFKDDPNLLMIHYNTADDNGIYGKPYGRRDFDNWIHIYHVFRPDRYKPGHGYPLIVGKFITPESPFAGRIGEIRIWRGARSREQISEYRDKPLIGDEPRLAACWTFEQTEGQIAYDISPNRNHARLGKSIKADEADPKWIDLQVEIK